GVCGQRGGHHRPPQPGSDRRAGEVRLRRARIRADRHGAESCAGAGFLLVGLDSTGDADLGDAALRAPLALVLGAEGKGPRQLTRTTCDQGARLDLPGRIKSLNVSNAAALALYVVTKRTG